MIKVFQAKAKIIYNKRVTDNYFQAAVMSAEISRVALPGQFVNIRVVDTNDVLLRRPFSIHRVEGEKIIFLYEVKGKGTEILSQRKEGEYLDIIGPLGNGFDLNWQTGKLANRQTILVAGGMGVAPLVFLAERLVRVEGVRCKVEEKIKPLVLIGAKTKTQVLCENEFKKSGCEVKVATDDGSRGFKGWVTDLLDRHVCEGGHIGPPLQRIIYACGPAPMLKALAQIAGRNNIDAVGSLEAHMACGIGSCMGCVVKVARAQPQAGDDFEYKRVCKEGPVFDLKQIIW